MATLAIKGDTERTEDIRKLFTDLAADEISFSFFHSDYLFYIGNKKEVLSIKDQPENIYRNLLFKVYTIEEFRKQFPFKVGDMVAYDIYTGVDGSKKEKTSGIKSMCWLHEYNEVCYITEDGGKHFAKALRVSFKPKDGDVVFQNGMRKWIFIYKDCLTAEAYEYVSMELDSNGICFPNGGYIGYVDTLLPATEEQKKLLFDKLKEEGYEWNTEKKELVRLKWEPKSGDAYFTPAYSYIDGLFFVDKLEWRCSSTEIGRYGIGYVFKTSEECKTLCDKLNQAIEGVKP